MESQRSGDLKVWRLCRHGGEVVMVVWRACRHVGREIRTAQLHRRIVRNGGV